MATQRNHQNNFATNLTSNQIAGVTTTPLNSIPSIAAPFSIALDATNLNSKYEIVEVTSKTATNILHAATTYAHTTAEEVRMVVGATELDEFAAKTDASNSGWVAYSAVTPTYTSADDPTYTITFASVDLTSIMGVGMKVKFTNNSTTFYGIITAIAFSTNTVVTLYGGTDYDVANSAISAFYYSTVKAPLGFPLDPTKWMVRVTNGSDALQASPTSGTWYNPGTTSSQISLPIGSWNVRAIATMYTNLNSGTTINAHASFSTSASAETVTDMTHRMYSIGPTAGSANFFKYKTITVASKTLYYLIAKTAVANTGNVGFINSDDGDSVLEAVSAYL